MDIDEDEVVVAIDDVSADFCDCEVLCTSVISSVTSTHQYSALVLYIGRVLW